MFLTWLGRVRVGRVRAVISNEEIESCQVPDDAIGSAGRADQGDELERGRGWEEVEIENDLISRRFWRWRNRRLGRDLREEEG